MKRVTKSITIASMATMILACSGEHKYNDNKIMAFKNNLTSEEVVAGVMTPEVMWKLGRVGGSALSFDGARAAYSVTSYDMAANKGTSAIWLIAMGGDDSSAHKSVQITDPLVNSSSAQWSADGSTIYFISDKAGSSQVWSMAPSGDKLCQLTNIEGGIEAFGVAPSGDKLFYVKSTKVEKRSSSELYTDLPESKAKIYDDLMERHWNRWDDGSYQHIFIAQIAESEVVTSGVDILEKEPWDAPMAPYFDAAEIAWSNSGQLLAYTCKKLAGKEYALSTNSDIYIYNTQSATTTNLTEGMMGYDRYPVFSPDDSKIAFTSMERNGNESDKDRLFVVEISSGQKSYLTHDFDYNAANINWDGNGSLYFTSPIEATIQVCKVTIGVPVEVLTSGLHDINAISLKSGRMIAERTTLSSPTEIFEIDLATGAIEAITEVNNEFNASIKMGEVERRMVRTTDGKEMLTWVVLPPDFDSTKKYPALLYCQGGPQSVVSQFWSYRWNAQLMAARGYIVVMPNRRGVPSFGQQWLDQISGDYSGQNIRDYLSAIDNVSAEPWVDKERLGCVGASYGGYSAYFLAGHHNKRFKAFIAHCGMFNLESMFGSTEELWFPMNDMGGTYWSDDKVAKRSYDNSPHKFVQNWDTPLLIFVGLKDFRIPYTESLQAFTAARMMGVPSRLVTFEDEAHQVFKPQNSLLWNREFFGWLDKYLVPR